MQKKYSSDALLVEAFLTIYLIKYGSFLALSVDKDDIAYLLKEEIDYVNSSLSDFLTLHIDEQKEIVIQFKNFLEVVTLENDIIKLVSLLQGRQGEDVLSFVDINFSSSLKERILPFFDFVCGGGRYPKSSILQYVESLHNFKLSKLLSFIYYGIGNDNEHNTTLSISLLSEVMEKYPLFSSFYLLRMRQRFNLVYKILKGVNQFNKLISTESGRKIIYEDTNIIECFSDLDAADKLFPNNPVYYLFKGKFLLHLLDYKGLPMLVKFLKLKGILFDVNVFSWFGVYYLQMGDAKAAKPYLELVHYSETDRYKAYSKLLFLYVKGEYQDEFSDLLNGHFKDNVEVLLYDKGMYYGFDSDTGSLKEIPHIDDSYNHKDKMGFRLDDFDAIKTKSYKNKDDYIEAVYRGISRNYYDHWSSELHRKVIFYSRDNFLFGHTPASYFH